MLLRELFHPLSDPAKWKSDSQWKVERISNGDATLVRFSNSGGDGVAISTAYYFTTRGLFVTRNHAGLMAQWSGHAVFAGHIVAKHLVISAGERKLLEADVTVTDASTTNISEFDQAGSPATPSQTLMPLEFVATPPKPPSDSPGWLGFGAAALSYWGVVDRTGRVHELEVIQSVGDAETHNFLKDLRRARFGPARIEGEPCEVGLVGVIGRSIH
jgi:hypothetical protein